MSRDTLLDNLPRCARCGEIFTPGGAFDTVGIRWRSRDGRVGPQRDFHRACAPLINGRLPAALNVHVVPVPLVQNQHWRDGAQVGWTMRRLLPNGHVLVQGAVAIHAHLFTEFGRKVYADGLRKARRRLRSMAKKGGR